MTSGNYQPPYRPLYLTPDSIPVGRFCRTIIVPDDPAWVGLVDGVLSALTDPKVWRQFGALTPEETAEAWLAMIDDSWEAATMPCCPVFAVDPSTGLLMQSDDDGITFYRVPDGPYIPGDGPFSSPPPPLNKGSDTADKCQAAWNAVAVINQFYKETIGQVTLDLWNTVLDVNRFLYQVNNTLLQLLYPDAVQLGLAQELNAFPWSDYTDLPQLTDEQQSALVCLLLQGASVTDGIVSFDFDAFDAGIDDAIGENPGTAVQLLVEYIGSPGLNTAGGVMAVSDPDCSECDGWCYTFDFTVDDGGWSPAGGATWVSGQGWKAGTYGAPPVHTDLTMTFTFPASAQVDQILLTITKPAATDSSNTQLALNLGADNVFFDANWSGTGTNITGTYNPGVIADNIYIDSNAGITTDPMYLISITFSGSGANPFGDDNC